MTSNELEKLEDFIVAIILTKVDIQQNTNGRTLLFEIEARKIPVLMDYIQRNHLESQINFDTTTLTGYVRPSLMLESILRVWVKDNQVIVIDPHSLRINTYYTWISLFAIKLQNSVAIPSTLTLEIQYSLSKLFSFHFGIQLVLGSLIQIKPFSPIMLNAIKMSRSIKESMELSYLVPERERETLKSSILEWEEGRTNYAY